MKNVKNGLTKKAANFLNKDEHTMCSQIAATNVKESVRAAALLQVHNGDSQKKVAEKTGLSVSQVQYLCKRFREKRLGIFPALLLTDLTQKQEAIGEKAEKIVSERTDEPKTEDKVMAKSKGKEKEKKKTKSEKKKNKKVKDKKKGKKKAKKTKSKKQDKKKSKKNKKSKKSIKSKSKK